MIYRISLSQSVDLGVTKSGKMEEGFHKIFGRCSGYGEEFSEFK
jgi:hypothetical protein